MNEIIKEKIDHCIKCGSEATSVVKNYMPGMFILNKILCLDCNSEIYVTISTSHYIDNTVIFDNNLKILHASKQQNWRVNWLLNAYRNRVSIKIKASREIFSKVVNPVVLNCIDKLYGHCLLKLINAQYHLDCISKSSLIVIVPKFLRWMVPEGPSEIWTYDIKLKEGQVWNDWIAEDIVEKLKSHKNISISKAYSHPHPNTIDITRFTRVNPFQFDSLKEIINPVVTFIWREDRFWCDTGSVGLFNNIKFNILKKFNVLDDLKIQHFLVSKLFEAIKNIIPTVKFKIIGQGNSYDFSNDIEDMRVIDISTQLEKDWCENYAKSHVVIGIHGSNMLLPSAHSRSTIVLNPSDRFGNIFQDNLSCEPDPRMYAFRNRCIPCSTSVSEIAAMVKNMIFDFKKTKINFIDNTNLLSI